MRHILGMVIALLCGTAVHAEESWACKQGRTKQFAVKEFLNSTVNMSRRFVDRKQLDALPGKVYAFPNPEMVELFLPSMDLPSSFAVSQIKVIDKTNPLMTYLSSSDGRIYVLTGGNDDALNFCGSKAPA